MEFPKWEARSHFWLKFSLKLFFFVVGGTNLFELWSKIEKKTWVINTCFIRSDDDESSVSDVNPEELAKMLEVKVKV